MIHVIGIGLDGLAGLTESAKEIIAQATVLVGSERHLSYIPQSHRAKRFCLVTFQDTLNQVAQLQSETVIILVSGDPLFFGLGRLLLEKFPKEELQFYPHLTSVQLAFNRVKVPWQNAKIISLHGRSLEALIKPLQQGKEKIAVLTDGVNTPGAIAQLYLSLQLPISYQFWVCENLGDPKLEKVQAFSATELKNQDFAKLNIVILIRQKQANQQLDLDKIPLLGIPDDYFLTFPDRPGLMTKKEVRIAILSELALQPNQVVWDIGAGTGSVSIEIARLSPNSNIYAIEKTAIGYNLIQQNCRRFQTNNIQAINGIAPDALEKLPSPHRIFIGGSSGKLNAILDACQAKIKQDGKIVFALATLEHFQLALNWLNQNNWQYHLLQLQIARSIPVAQLTRFSPLNPVTLVTASPRLID
jgi:precorrin-6Y C5,15-methyltransferase (decarboxylating)